MVHILAFIMSNINIDTGHYCLYNKHQVHKWRFLYSPVAALKLRDLY